MIPWFVEGTMNVLKYHGIIVGPMGRTGRDTNIFIANSGHTLLATHCVWAELYRTSLCESQKVRLAYFDCVSEMPTIIITQDAVQRLISHCKLRFSLIFLDIECEANPMCAGFRTVLCGVFAER